MNSETAMSVVHSFGTLSTDVLGVFAFVVLLIALGLSKGKKILFTLLLALYPATLLTYFFPFYEIIHIENVAKEFVSLVVFFVTFILSFLLIRKHIYAEYQYNSLRRFLEVLVLSVTVIGFLIASLYHVAGLDTYYSFSYIFTILFSSPTAFFLWTVTPLTNMLL